MLPLTRLAVLWAAGTVSTIAAGAIVFGGAIFVPGRPPYQCIAAGILVAGVLAAVRVARPGLALALVAGWVALHLGAAIELGWPRILARPGWCVAIGLGACVTAAVFDRLAVHGYAFGKFLIAGPMLSGVWLSATPMLLLGDGERERLLAEFLMNALLGLVIGDGAGFGVEAAEWVLGRKRGEG